MRSNVHRTLAMILLLGCLQLIGCTPLTSNRSTVAESPNGALLAATPELDSLLLFTSGTASLLGYALLRLKRPLRNPVVVADREVR